MTGTKNEYIYFLYSEEQIREKNKILKKLNMKFQPGVVVVNGVRKEFTCIDTSPNIGSRLYDVVVVAEGFRKDFIYEDIKNIAMKGN